jgi:hypothetical protein
MDYLSQINKNICGDEFKIRDNSYFNLIYDFIIAQNILLKQFKSLYFELLY